MPLERLAFALPTSFRLSFCSFFGAFLMRCMVEQIEILFPGQNRWQIANTNQDIELAILALFTRPCEIGNAKFDMISLLSVAGNNQ